VQELENHESVAANKKRSKKRLRLDDCFKLFCMNEQLSENDQWCTVLGFCFLFDH